MLEKERFPTERREPQTQKNRIMKNLQLGNVMIHD